MAANLNEYEKNLLKSHLILKRNSALDKWKNATDKRDIEKLRELKQEYSLPISPEVFLTKTIRGHIKKLELMLDEGKTDDALDYAHKYFPQKRVEEIAKQRLETLLEKNDYDSALEISEKYLPYRSNEIAKLSYDNEMNYVSNELSQSLKRLKKLKKKYNFVNYDDELYKAKQLLESLMIKDTISQDKRETLNENYQEIRNLGRSIYDREISNWNLKGAERIKQRYELNRTPAKDLKICYLKLKRFIENSVSKSIDYQTIVKKVESAYVKTPNVFVDNVINKQYELFLSSGNYDESNRLNTIYNLNRSEYFIEEHIEM